MVPYSSSPHWFAFWYHISESEGKVVPAMKA